MLINAAPESIQEPEVAITEVPETVAMLQRIEQLELGLSEALRQLEVLRAAPPIITGNAFDAGFVAVITPQTLQQILRWLADQAQVSVAALRTQLLPLDLLPSAVIDELNEQALDLTGDIALEEVDGDIVVNREVLRQVLAERG